MVEYITSPFLWATWCSPCRAEMPSLEAVYQAHRNQAFVVLAVDQMESQATVAAFVEQVGLTFPVLLDTDGQVSRTYRVMALPTSFFLDRQGIIRDVVIGGLMSQNYIEGKVAPLLREKFPQAVNPY